MQNEAGSFVVKRIGRLAVPSANGLPDWIEFRTSVRIEKIVEAMGAPPQPCAVALVCPLLHTRSVLRVAYHSRGRP